MRDEHIGLDAAQIEALAARAHGDRDFFDLGRRENEFRMFRRLFERLQQTVEGLLREHMHFVDDIDLGAGEHGAIADRLDDLAHIVDAGVRRRVHFDHIDMARIDDRLTMHAEFRHMDRRAA